MIGVGSFIALGNTLKNFGVTVNSVFNSIVSAFNADGDATDQLNYANGTLTNGATASGTAKVGTNSFSFDGVNDYVDCGINKWNFTDAFTVSAWTYINATGAARCVASSFYDAATTKGWSLRVDNLTNKMRLSIWTGSLETTCYSISTVTTGVFQHWVVSIASDKTVKFYLNGTLDNTTSIANFPTYNSSSYCYIGSQYGFYYWNGYLDAIQIFNTELTSGNVTTLYNSGTGRQYPN